MEKKDVKDFAARGVLYADFETRRYPEQVVNEDGTIRWYRGSLEPNLVGVQDAAGQISEHFSFRTGSSSVEEQFLEYVTSLNEHKEYVIIFHNLTKFDGVFLYQAARRRREDLSGKPIPEGSGFMTFTLKKEHPCFNKRGKRMKQNKVVRYRFVDSLKFVSQPLSKFPKTFGLDSGPKGFFPYLFDTPEHAGYVGPIPGLKYFLKRDARLDTLRALLMQNPGDDDKRLQAMLKSYDDPNREIIKWWLEWHRSGREYDLYAERLKYCMQDVEILRQGFEKYREINKEVALIDPLDKFTLAGVCLLNFQQSHLKHSICGFNETSQENTSIKCHIWFATLAKQDLQHRYNGGEHRIFVPEFGQHIPVDGFLSPAPDAQHNPSDSSRKGTVYQFHGCYWHKCRQCDYNAGGPNDRYEYTVLLTKTLRKMGYEVVELWEHDFDQDSMMTQLYKEQLSELKKNTGLIRGEYHLKLRSAVYGGRTNASCLFWQARKGERGHYVDICSLYPYVMYMRKYPVGEPDWEQSYPDPDKILCNGPLLVKGFLECSVDPPRGLRHPVLPLKIAQKLCFTLCYTCAKAHNQERSCCDHTEAQRRLFGIWTTEELQKALDCGYRIHKIHKVIFWNEDKWVDNMFKSYIGNWLKIKLEASGLPRGYTKETYIAEAKEKYDIDLEYNKIERNPGLRAIAKLYLNSLWGKFTQNPDRAGKEIVWDRDKYWKMLDQSTQGSIAIRRFQWIDTDPQDVGCVVHYSRNMTSFDTNSHLHIGAFVTSYARLHLYEMLELLGEQVLYYDTDSCIYKIAEDGPSVIKDPSHMYFGHHEGAAKQYGSLLGEWESELDGDDYIVWFCGTAPKSYAYATHNGKRVLKLKGISLGRFETGIGESLSGDDLKSLVDAHVFGDEEAPRRIPVSNANHFYRDSLKGVQVDELQKIVGFTYTKRQIDWACMSRDFVPTLPWGY